MMKRKVVNIDQEKCNGCGLCVDACHEGAIELVNGKARLVSDVYCDGLGACLGECPQDAIRIEEREAAPFDVEAVKARQQHSAKPPPSGCPGMRALSFGADPVAGSATPSAPAASAPSQLRQWPVQLHLVPVEAPYWAGADLLISADCVAFAYGDFHGDLLRGRRLVIACPKLDDTSAYVDKLARILALNDIRSVTVAHMEVPCCTGLVRIVSAALDQCGKDVPFATVKVGLRGDVLERQSHPTKGDAAEQGGA